MRYFSSSRPPTEGSEPRTRGTAIWPERGSRILWAAVIPALALGPRMGEMAAQEVALPLGAQAPAADLEDLDGNPVQILDYVEEGKPTLIEFWASWCEQCEALQPQMDEIEARFGAEVNLLAVAVAVSQTPRRVKRTVEEHGYGYPFLWDGSGDAVRRYQVPTTSVVILLDAAGRVAYAGSGGGQDLIGAVEALLEGSRGK